MDRITHKISLDTSKNGVQKILQGFNVGDQVARRIEIALTNGGVSVPLADTGITALMYVTVDGIASVNAVTIEEGKAIYDVDANDTATSGIVDMNLKILDTVTGMVLHAPRFQLEVWENGIGSSTAATSPTFTALESALAQAQLYSQKTIKSVTLDEDTKIFRVEYMDESAYESSVIADALELIGNVEQYVERAEEASVNAEKSEANALASELNSKISEDNAKESELNAKASETAVTASEAVVTAAEANVVALEATVKGYKDSVTASEINAKTSEQNALDYSIDANLSKASAQRSEANALTSEQNAQTSETNALASEQNAEAYAKTSESYAIGGTGTRAGEDTDNAKHYMEQCQQIAGGMQGGFLPMGTISFAQLPTSNIGQGWMYNIVDEFTSDSRFMDGAGKKYAAGSNVYYTASGKWDVLSGAIPTINGKNGNVITLGADDIAMTNYAKASTASDVQPTDSILEAIGKVEKKADDLDSTKADKATTLAGYGITDARIDNGEIIIGGESITPATEDDIEDVPHSEPVEDYAGIEPPTIDADILGGKYRASDVDEIKDDISNIKSDMSRMHNYSTAEHVVGKWIDGRDVYERTVVTNALYIVAESGFNVYRATVPINNIRQIVSLSGQMGYDGAIVALPNVSFARGNINDVATNFALIDNSLICTAIFYTAVQTTVRFEMTVKYLKA